MRNKLKTIAVIPARMAASRFPGKPLAKILDLPMIEHVRRRVELCEGIDDVYVATCDQEIVDVVEKNNGKAIMTANTHQRCTDRVEEAVQNIEADIVIIFQGDEPLFSLDAVRKLTKPMIEDKDIVCTNLLSPINNDEDLNNQDNVKVLVNNQGNIIYFSRSAIPYEKERTSIPAYRQTGLSAFRSEFLKTFTQLPQTPLEQIESIDFLRIIEHGYSIRAVLFEQQMVGVDNPENIGQIEEMLKQDPAQAEIYKQLIKS